MMMFFAGITTIVVADSDDDGANVVAAFAFDVENDYVVFAAIVADVALIVTMLMIQLL